MMTTDMYRGHHTYGMQFYFATVQGVSTDGDVFGISIQEGIGRGYSGTDRATEDTITIDGKVYKLDRSTFEFTTNGDDRPTFDFNLKGSDIFDKEIKTITEGKVFPDNSCELTFRQDAAFADGLNLVILAHRREYQLGKYDVKCRVGNKWVEAKNARGFFELVWSRN